ncbi:MAG: histidinol phosphatase [Crocinitomicaceae bacterium]|nr:histidinol phosphatase [Crocinitomicaceae bacterium]
MSFWNRIFSKNEESFPNVDLSIFQVDMHSHLIPGIDDGSKTMDHTIAMLAKFQSLGYHKVITTPHIMSDYYRNTPDIILGGLENVRAELKKLNLKIEIEAAAEYYFDDALMKKLINKEPLLTFSGKHVLFEFSFHSQPEQIDKLIFELVTQGYIPVLAHFERYVYFHGSVDKAIEYRKSGVLIQLNFNSIFGHYGPDVKKQAELLIDSGEIDFVATDCHRIEHLLILENNLNKPYLHKLSALKLKNNSL